MASMKQIKEIAKTLDIDSMDYMHIGIRVQEDTYGAKIGDKITHCSKVWVDGDETDEELDGVSALDPSLVKYFPKLYDYSAYIGNVVLILGTDNDTEIGEDVGEIIMDQPTVLDIIYVEE